MKVACRKLCLPAMAVTAVVMITSCPLPFQYNGKTAAGPHALDPSTPGITAPVVMSYAEQGGTSGVLTADVPLVSSKTTTVTLSTQTAGAVIFYTDDGTPITSLASAKRISGSQRPVHRLPGRHATVSGHLRGGHRPRHAPQLGRPRHGERQPVSDSFGDLQRGLHQ